jgi:hypothetical protein
VRRAVVTAVAAIAWATVVPAAAQAQTPANEDASGSIVTVEDSSGSTTVGQTTATVTTGSSSDPATGKAVLIEESGEAAGEATSGASDAFSRTEATSDSTESASVNDAAGTTATPTPETTSADTAANVTIGDGKIVAADGRDRVRVVVRGGRSTATARRRGRRMETSASTRLGADVHGNGLSVDGVVTVGRLRAATHSRAGGRAGSRRTLRIRDLRIRAARGARPVIHVRWARMLTSGRLRARITIRPGDGSKITRTIAIRRSRRGRDLLARSTYRGTALAAAFRRLERARLSDVADDLQAVRMGGSRVTRRGNRTTARVDGVTVELKVAAARSGAGTSQLGILTAVAGSVSSAATAAATSVVTVAEQTAGLTETIAEVAAEIPEAVSALPAVLTGETFTIRGQLLKLERDEVRLVIICAADFAGELFLLDAADETVQLVKSKHISCRDGERRLVSLTITSRFYELAQLPRGVAVLPEVELDASDASIILPRVVLTKPE